MDEFTALIGYNNAGKTNILLGCHWLFSGFSLDTSAFNDQNQPIEVEGDLNVISEKVLDRLGRTKEILNPWVKDGYLKIRRRQILPNAKPEKIEFYVMDLNKGGGWVLVPPGFKEALTLLFPDPIRISSSENMTQDLSGKDSSTIIGKLIAEIIEPIEREYGAHINETMKGLKALLDADGKNRAPELAAFDAKANEKIEPLFPSIRVKLHVPTPELREVFRGSTLKVYEDDDTQGRDVSALGHGARRSIQMALIRHLADAKAGINDPLTRTLLLIDSPELFLHPQAVELVRVSLKKLSKEGYQIIFATHSAQMVTSDDVNTSLLIRKDRERGTFKRKRIEDAVRQVIADAPSQLQMLFSLSNSNEILFSEKVLLTEGKTELRILPHLFEKISGESFAMRKCALIRQGGVSNTRKSMHVLEAMDLPVKAIVDLDYVLTTAAGDKFLRRTNKDLVLLRGLMGALANKHQIRLVGDWPTNRDSSMSAAEAIALLAKQPRAKDPIHRIHELMLKKNIWVWERGAIEDHLGISGKSEGIWSEFIGRVQNHKLEEIIPDPAGLSRLVAWINS